MPSPRDPHEVEPTLLPGAPARPNGVSETPRPAAQDATVVNPTRRDAEATDADADVDITQMPTGPGTVAGPASGRTYPSAGAAPGSDRVSNDTLPSPAASSGSAVRSVGPLSGTGTSIGRYSLRGLHASGGLGEVFAARDTELNREVAVKRIKSRYADDPGSRRRFLTEAELTARLDHPGVVPVFGLVNDVRGRPVYAMRFIRGETLKDEIDRYHNQGDKKQDSAKTEGEGKWADPGLAAAPVAPPSAVPRTVAFRQLLSRFVAVCQAIAYAHEKGIIHRDIKPANVMVGKFGEVLVVDWGLAKSLTDGPDPARLMKHAADAGFRHDPEATDLPSHATMAGTAVGTPSYMPPEQAAGQLDKVGPRADVYSLGATLFVILTGKAPFTGKSAVETLDQVRKGAFEPPGAVNADCPKPLDAICRKAMALSPDDRYPSAQALAADVERWLSDEPVSAYQDPFTARAARWARRHPARVAAAASLLLAGLIAAAGIAWAVHLGEKETARERDNVVKQKQETDAALAEVTRQKQETADALAREKKAKEDVEAERDRVARAREIARERYEKAVAAYGTLVHDIDKKLRDRAGMQDTRERLLLNAADGLTKLIAKRDEDVLDADHTLVAAHRQLGEVYELVGRTTDARAQHLEAEKVARAVRANADATDRRTAEQRAKDVRAADRDLARTLAALAGIQAQAGDTTAALKAADEAVALSGALAADNTDAARQELAAARVRRATVLLERGETGTALTECQLALETRRALAGADKKDAERRRDLAASLDALAGIQLRTGNTDGAEKSATESLAIRAAVAKDLAGQPDAQRELAAAHARLGDIHSDRGLMAAARKEYQAGIELLEALVKGDPQNAAARAELADLYGRLGHVRIRTGDTVAAVLATGKSKTLCQELLDTDRNSAKAQRDLALAHERYGEALLDGGDKGEALKEYDAARALRQKLQKLDAGSAAAKLELARAWARTGDGRLALKDPTAADAFAESVKWLEEVGDKESASVKRDLAGALYKLADAHTAAKKPALAAPLAAKATKLLVDLAAANPDSGQARRDVATAYGNWGRALAGDGRPTVALVVWQGSLGRFKKLAEEDKTNVQAKEEEATACERLARFHASTGNGEAALANARRAVAVWEEIGAAIGPDTPAGARRLALARVQCGDICADVYRLFPRAAEFYKQALEALDALGDRKADRLIAPVYALAVEKLLFIEAVKAGLKNTQNLADRRFDAVRLDALRTVARLELQVNHFVNAATAAEELTKGATAPDDLFAAARVFAGCTARGAEPAKGTSAKSAVGALKRAVDADFRDADALTAPEWEVVGRHDPEFPKVVDKLKGLIAAGK